MSPLFTATATTAGYGTSTAVLINREAEQSEKASNRLEEGPYVINVLIRLRWDGGNKRFALGWVQFNLHAHAAALKRVYRDVCPNSYAWALNGRFIAAALPVKTLNPDSSVGATEEDKTPSDVVFWSRDVSEVNPQTMIPAGFNADDSRVIGSLEGTMRTGNPIRIAC